MHALNTGLSLNMSYVPYPSIIFGAIGTGGVLEKKGRYKAYSLGIWAYFSEIGSKKHVIKPSKIIKLDVWQKLQVGFFDGACANGQCGCGDLIVTEPG